jgi:hypothetical protein
MQVELYAKQFDWTARYPGADGGLGATDFRLINGDEPVGYRHQGEHHQRRMDELGRLDKEIAEIGQHAAHDPADTKTWMS